jgi:glutamyl-tRNA reductase
MSELLLLGTSHKTAPLAVRERVALTEGRAERFLLELAGHPEIREAVVLSTCNRTELYVVVSDPVEAETTVLGMLARQAGLRPTELIDGIYTHRNCDAARHLYRVTSGLESMIVGEAEVQGQVKRAYEAALSARTTGPLTNKLFRAALATGKRVRTETSIGAGGASIASVAVEAARGALGELASRHVLIIGAGETAELTARALSEQGVSTMFVANRRRERAIALARRFGGSTIAFDALPSELERADIVVASTASPHSIVGAEELALVTAARGGRPLLLLDLAVPRDVDPDSSTSTGSRPRSRAPTPSGGSRPGARRASSRRRSRASPAGSGRSRCSRRSPRCASRPTGSSPSCWPRTSTAGRALASATASASRRCCAPPSSGCCTSRRSA